MGRDILGCQKMEKVGYGIFLHIDSYNLHDNKFFVENELSLSFILDRLLFLSRVIAVSSRCQMFLGHAISYVNVIGFCVKLRGSGDRMSVFENQHGRDRSFRALSARTGGE
jgi:hypothetical protein